LLTFHNRIKERFVLLYNSSQGKSSKRASNREAKTGDVEKMRTMTTSENLSSEKTVRNMPKS
jgi:hypothetical protein